MIRIGSIFRSAGKPKGFPSIKNINKRVFGEAAEGVDISKSPTFNQFLETNPQVYEQMESIDAALNSPYVFGKADKNRLKQLFVTDPDNIKQIYGEIDSLRRTEKVVADFKKVGGLEGNINLVKSYMKDSFRASEHGSNQAYWLMEKNLLNRVLDQVEKPLKPQAKRAFTYLLGNPKKFREEFEIDQDIFVKTLMGVDNDQVTKHPILSKVRDSFEELDREALKYIQDIGVPIGQYDDFFLPFKIPKDSTFRVNMKELLEETVDMRPERIDYLVKHLKTLAEDTTKSTGFRFKMRSIKLSLIHI